MGNKIPYKGICEDCLVESEEAGDICEEKWIMNKRPPLCKYHKQKRKNGTKNNIQSTRSRTNGSKKNNIRHSRISEKELFNTIWTDEEPNGRRSFVTGKPLPDIHRGRAWYFSHILPKGKGRYPMFKYYRKNVVLKTLEEHTLWEYHKYKIKDNPLWSHVFQLKEELEQEYIEHKKQYDLGKVEYYKY